MERSRLRLLWSAPKNSVAHVCALVVAVLTGGFLMFGANSVSLAQSPVAGENPAGTKILTMQTKPQATVEATAGKLNQSTFLPFMRHTRPSTLPGFAGIPESGITSGLSKYLYYGWSTYCDHPDTHRLPMIWGRKDLDSTDSMARLFNGVCNDGRPLLFLNEPAQPRQSDRRTPPRGACPTRRSPRALRGASFLQPARLGW